jgi:hypothetical protein
MLNGSSVTRRQSDEEFKKLARLMGGLLCRPKVRLQRQPKLRRAGADEHCCARTRSGGHQKVPHRCKEHCDSLSQEIRTFARMITSLIEEAEAISWYKQRMSVEKDKDAKAIMANAQKEEFKHFGMNLEFLLRKNADWRAELQGILFTKGDIVERGEAAEKKVD